MKRLITLLFVFVFLLVPFASAEDEILSDTSFIEFLWSELVYSTTFNFGLSGNNIFYDPSKSSWSDTATQESVRDIVDDKDHTPQITQELNKIGTSLKNLFPNDDQYESVYDAIDQAGYFEDIDLMYQISDLAVKYKSVSKSSFINIFDGLHDVIVVPPVTQGYGVEAKNIVTKTISFLEKYNSQDENKLSKFMDVLEKAVMNYDKNKWIFDNAFVLGEKYISGDKKIFDIHMLIMDVTNIYEDKDLYDDSINAVETISSNSNAQDIYLELLNKYRSDEDRVMYLNEFMIRGYYSKLVALSDDDKKIMFDYLSTLATYAEDEEIDDFYPFIKPYVENSESFIKDVSLTLIERAADEDNKKLAIVTMCVFQYNLDDVNNPDLVNVFTPILNYLQQNSADTVANQLYAEKTNSECGLFQQYVS